MNILKKVFGLAKAHRMVAGIIIILLGVGGFYGYRAVFGNVAQTKYVLTTVRKGNLITTVSGSGQVSVSDQVDLKLKASGDVVYVGVTNGQEVKSGKLIAQLDTTDAQRAVRDAETSLETAKLELDKLTAPTDALTLLQAENSLTQAQESKQSADDSLAKAYDDGFNTVSNAFLDLPGIMAGCQNILFGNSLNSGEQNIDFFADSVKIYDEKVLQYRDDAYKNFSIAKTAYDKAFGDYKALSRFSDKAAIESLINESYATTKSIAESLKSTINLIQFYEDKLTERNIKPQTLADTYLSNLNSYTGKTNSDLLGLLSAKTTIQNDKNSIVNAQRSVEESSLSLDKIKAGPDSLDVRADQIAIQQKSDALTTAKQDLNNCYVYAPFDGVISKVDVKKGDSVSSGSAVATLITKQQVAELSLNEIDAAKVAAGQKATLTFDAVSDLRIDGQVSEVDTVGTVSQGVVSYNLQIAFDAQDSRVKPGMSVTATIVTDSKQDVLLVSNSAIKSIGNRSYVEMPALNESLGKIATSTLFGGVVLNYPIRQQSVEIGVSNDTFSEILSGLNEGDRIISKTILGSAQTTTTAGAKTQTGNSAGSILRATGIGGGGGFSGGK